jgi:hypothetical protein
MALDSSEIGESLLMHKAELQQGYSLNPQNQKENIAPWFSKVAKQ